MTILIISILATAFAVANLIVSLSTRRKITAMDTATSAALKDLTDKVTNLTTVEAGLGTVVDTASQVISGFSAQLAAAVASAGSTADPALVSALTSLGATMDTAAADLTSKKSELSAALVANTPTAPASPTT